MYTYCSFQSVNLYKHTKPRHQGRMYKYTLLKNRIFRYKECSKQILQNDIFFSLFTVINIT